MLIDYSLRDFLEVRLRDSFLVIETSQDTLVLKSKQHRDSQYTLFLRHLDGEHIYQIAEILEEVYRNAEVPNKQNYMDKTVSRVPLNQPSAVSGKFVDTVLSLHKSSMHKLFLLTSGTYWLTENTSDLVFAMASQKQDFGDSPTMIFGYRHDFFEGMRKYYILPALYGESFMNGGRPNWIFEGSRNSLDQTARLLAFIGYRDSTTTFAEYSRINFAKAIKTDRGINNFTLLNSVQKILTSSYYTPLAESMTAAELIALSKIIPNSGYELRLPIDFLRNRARAMAQRKDKELHGYVSIYWHLSDEQVDAFDVNNSLAMIDKALLGNPYTETPPFIYAAFAEVIVAMGEKKAFEIIKELIHIPFARDAKPEVYEATTALILEALNPENSDVPFGWAAQMSEHSWVLQIDEQNRAELKV